MSNCKQTHAPLASKDTDDITGIITAIFQQDVGHEPDLSDKNQAFLQEVLIRHGKQMNVVTYLKAAVDDVAKFCCGQGPFFKTLVMDATFNIAEYCFTQTVYRHLAVLKRRDDGHPWFPMPTMAHRDKSTSDFSYFWQACKRGNGALANLRCLGTDEDEALIQGIYGEKRVI